MKILRGSSFKTVVTWSPRFHKEEIVASENLWLCTCWMWLSLCVAEWSWAIYQTTRSKSDSCESVSRLFTSKLAGVIPSGQSLSEWMLAEKKLTSQYPHDLCSLFADWNVSQCQNAFSGGPFTLQAKRIASPRLGFQHCFIHAVFMNSGYT